MTDLTVMPQHHRHCASVTQLLACDPPRPSPCTCGLDKLREDSEMLDYVIDRRDFLWDHWDMTSEEVKQAIRKAIEGER